MQKICNNISAPIKNIKFLNHLAYELHKVDIALSLVYSVEGNILQLATRNVDLSKPFSYLHLDQIVFVSNKHP